MVIARGKFVKENEVGTYHCISRCVRRAFLCGEDIYSGKNYEHRRGWIRDRLKELSLIFGVEVFSYAVMSNHLHIVIRNRPDLVKSWSDEEVVKRWSWLFPKEREDTGNPLPPIPAYVQNFLKDSEKLLVCRQRLGSLSWFMRCLNEKIARRANQEDQCSGRFWEGRFKSQPLLDEGAILACMAYVDLNPVRAAMAEDLEESTFTSIYDRLLAERARKRLEKLKSEEAFKSAMTQEQERCVEKEQNLIEDASWLVSLDGENSPFEGSIPLQQYTDLLEWTGKNIKADKIGHLPPPLESVLDRYDLDADLWVSNVAEFGGLFYRIVGSLEKIFEYAKSRGQKFFCGYSGSAQLYQKSS